MSSSSPALAAGAGAWSRVKFGAGTMAAGAAWVFETAAPMAAMPPIAVAAATAASACVRVWVERATDRVGGSGGSTPAAASATGAGGGARRGSSARSWRAGSCGTRLSNGSGRSGTPISA